MKLFLTRIFLSLFVVASLSTGILVFSNTARAATGSVLIAQSSTTPPKDAPPKDSSAATASSGGGLVPCGNDSAHPCTVGDIFRLIALLTNYLITGAGVFAIVFLVIAGVNMVTSVGNPEKLKSAKNHLTYAIIGLVLVLTAYIIVRFFLYDVLQLQGSNVLDGKPADFINTSGGSSSNTSKNK